MLAWNLFLLIGNILCAVWNAYMFVTHEGQPNYPKWLLWGHVWVTLLLNLPAVVIISGQLIWGVE